ncbi:MAG TPA: hypothetical protein ENK57_16025 [Polyangiaceae bacterium]|nr:hypothetical protein [Polyangiaceae bacterium]
MPAAISFRPALLGATFVATAAGCTSILDFGGYSYVDGTGGETSTGGGAALGGGGAGSGGGTGTGTPAGVGDCADDTRDGNETDVDCGGTCPPCTQGKMCELPTDCATGFCVDGRCCNDECAGTCRACSADKTGTADGLCTLIASGDDPDDECAAADTCNGDGSCGQCDMTPAAPGGTCPAVCDSCAGDTCIIQCSAGECKRAAVTCPADWNCTVDCDGAQACDGAMVGCSDYLCTVICNGNEACHDLTVACGKGACHTACQTGSGVCNGATVSCGFEACTCEGAASTPTLSCGSSCGCEPC